MAISAATLARAAILGRSEDLTGWNSSQHLTLVTQLLERPFPESQYGMSTWANRPELSSMRQFAAGGTTTTRPPFRRWLPNIQ